MDLIKIGHVGAEVVVVGGLAYLLNQQNTALRVQVEELHKKLTHVALHVQNLHEGYTQKLDSLQSEVDKLKKGSNRHGKTSTRDILRASSLDDNTTGTLAPVTLRTRTRLPPQDPVTPPIPSVLADTGEIESEESDPESILKAR